MKSLILVATLILAVLVCAALFPGCSGGGPGGGATGSGGGGGGSAAWRQVFPPRTGYIQVRSSFLVADIKTNIGVLATNISSPVFADNPHSFHKSASKGSRKVVVGDNGELRKADGNDNYQLIPTGTTEGLFDVKIQQNGKIKAVGGNLEVIIRESDLDGENLQEPTINNKGRLGRCICLAIDPYDETRQYIGGDAGYAVYNPVNGQWDCYNNFDKIQAIAAATVSGHNLVFLLKSTSMDFYIIQDGDFSNPYWSRNLPGASHAMAVSSDGRTIYVGGYNSGAGGRIYKIVINNLTTKDITATDVFTDVHYTSTNIQTSSMGFRSISVNPNDANDATATGSFGVILHTPNGGTRWDQQSTDLGQTTEVVGGVDRGGTTPVANGEQVILEQ